MKSLKSANFSSTIDKILRFALSKVKFSSISEEKFANFNVKAENFIQYPEKFSSKSFVSVVMCSSGMFSTYSKYAHNPCI